MANFIRIINWQHFQHYKNRNPPWIKLHRELLTSRTWVTADDASRVLAVACMVLAAETGNKIPLDPAYIRRRTYLNQDPNFDQLIAAEFIEIIDETGNASEALADASNLHQNPTPEGETETETETEKRQRREKRSGANAPSPVRIFTRPSLEEVRDYCQERGNRVNPQQFVDHYTANGWKVGRNSMKDWKAAVRTWEQRNEVNDANRKPATKREQVNDSIGTAIREAAERCEAKGIPY